MGFRAIERVKGVHNTTVMAWVKEVGAFRTFIGQSSLCRLDSSLKIADRILGKCGFARYSVGRFHRLKGSAEGVYLSFFRFY